MCQFYFNFYNSFFKIIYIFSNVFIIFKKIVLYKFTMHNSLFFKFLLRIFYRIIRHFPRGSRRCPIGHGNCGTVIIFNGDIVADSSVVDDVTEFLCADDNDTTVIIVTAIVNNAIQNFIFSIFTGEYKLSRTFALDKTF